MVCAPALLSTHAVLRRLLLLGVGTAVTVDGPPLPEGWAAAKDAQGRTYFWHKATKKVQWDRPTASLAPA